MISDPNLVLYACVAKGTTILAEFNSGDPNLTTLASQCLEQTPPFHATFSHTIRKRTYAFLIDNPDPFVYFSIVNENLKNSEVFWLLNRLKNVLDKNVQRNLIACSENVSSYCLQGDFNPVFRELLVVSRVEEFDTASSVESVLKNCRNLSLDDSSKGKKIVSVPLLGKPREAWLKLKKKRRLIVKNNNNNNNVDANSGNVIENKVDVIETREFSVPLPLHKNGLCLGESGRQKASQIWRRHVLIVLGIDVIVCLLLFVVWMLICKGFTCIAE